MNDLPLIIVNPKSGRGMTESKWASYASAIRTHYGAFDCEFTKGPGDAVTIAARESQAGRRLIIAMGGDGTVSEVANGILKSGGQAALGLLPGGTGGDFRRTLQVPGDIVEAAKQLKNAKEHLMDAGKLTYIDHQGNEQKRFFVNTCSFGMSGVVASRANRSNKRLGGTLTYASATIRTAFSFHAPDVVIQFDDQEQKRLKILVVVVANGPSFGGGMRIAPDAKLNDGKFDVLLAANLPAAKLLMNSHKLYSGTHLSMKEMAVIQARKIQAVPVQEKEEILLEVDGETPGRLPATIEIIDQILRVRA